ncbi:MAG: hypothetical protein GY722_04940 [bacterium]|nr:hypothetical protein [bacterium]
MAEIKRLACEMLVCMLILTDLARKYMKTCLRRSPPSKRGFIGLLDSDISSWGRKPRKCPAIALLLFLLGCGATLPHLRLGEPVPADAEKTGMKVMVSPSTFQHQWSWQYKSIEYSLGVDEQGTVQYLSTNSSRVETPEGVRVGHLFADLRRVEGVYIGEWTGWGHVAELPSGWKAAIFIGQTMTDREPKPDDRVELIFRGTSAGYGVSLPSNETLGE